MDAKNTTLDDIAAEIGLTATLRISAWFGGDHCYVPAAVEDGQLLVRLIGMSAARKLTLAFPGEHLPIPPLTQYELDLRARQIGKMLMKGFSTREVSNIMRMTERRVQQICRDLEMVGLIDPVGPSKKSGLPKGVYQSPSGRFFSTIAIGGVNTHLGTFDTISEASDAYQKARQKHRPEETQENAPEKVVGISVHKKVRQKAVQQSGRQKIRSGVRS